MTGQQTQQPQKYQQSQEIKHCEPQKQEYHEQSSKVVEHCDTKVEHCKEDIKAPAKKH